MLENNAASRLAAVSAALDLFEQRHAAAANLGSDALGEPTRDEPRLAA